MERIKVTWILRVKSEFYIAAGKSWMISDVFYDGKETHEENVKFLRKFPVQACVCADDTIKRKSS